MHRHNYNPEALSLIHTDLLPILQTRNSKKAQITLWGKLFTPDLTNYQVQ